jgi:hypothetical protein
MARRDSYETGGNSSLLGRRSYLRLAGAAAGAAALGSGAAAGSPPTDQYSNVIDVTEVGADPTGGSAVDPVIDQYAADDTLLVFPDGTYKLNRLLLSGLRNFGLAAAEGATPTVVPGQSRSAQGEVLVQFSGGDGWLLQGFEFDYRRDGYGGRIQLLPSGDVTVRDVHVRGQFPDNTFCARIDVRSSSGVGLVENVVARGGTRDNDDSCGIFVGKPHAGELTLRNCNVEGFSNNGVYASAPGLPDGGNGPVKVEGGLYRNNNIANVRIGSEGSYVRDATVVVDERPPEIHGVVNARGIRVRDRQDQVIENCDVLMSAAHGSGGLVLHSEAGRVFVRNTRVRVTTGGHNAIRAKSPSRGGSVGPVFDGVSVTGTADAPDAAVVADRPGTEFRNCCFDVDGGGQDGVVLTRCDDSVVADSTIDVPGSAVVASSSTVETVNVSKTGTCPLPSAEAGDGSTALPNTLTVAGDQSSDPVHYEFSVDGDLEKSLDNGATVDGDDTVSGGTATGSVLGGRDSYRFSGSITSFSIDGPATLYRNGDTVSPSDLDPTGDGSGGSGDDSTDDGSTDDGSTDDGSTDDGTSGDDSTDDGSSDGSTDDGSTQEYPNTITVGGGTASNPVHFEFAVSEAVRGSTDAGYAADDDDAISGTTVSGGVAGGYDRFEFAGEMTAWSADGDVTVWVNGSEVDPANVSSGPVLSNLVTVDGTSVDGRVDYALQVSGDLEKTDEAGSVNSHDTVAGSEAVGWVWGGRDSYRYAGEIAALSLGGDADVYVNGTLVDPSSLGSASLPNTLVVDGTDTLGSCDYRFEVTGDVARDASAASVQADDVVDGGVVEGSVYGGVDAFRFSGDVASFSVSGNATITFNDTDN